MSRPATVNWHLHLQMIKWVRTNTKIKLGVSFTPASNLATLQLPG